MAREQAVPGAVYRKRIIVLKTTTGAALQTEENAAGEALIKPGHLVVVKSDGKVWRHDSAAGLAVKSFALEREEMGKDIDVLYATGDMVKVGTLHGGERVLGILSSGENVAIGAMLNSNGDGTLQAGTANAIGRSLEAINATTGDARIRVELL